MIVELEAGSDGVGNRSKNAVASGFGFNETTLSGLTKRTTWRGHGHARFTRFPADTKWPRNLRQSLRTTIHQRAVSGGWKMLKRNTVLNKRRTKRWIANAEVIRTWKTVTFRKNQKMIPRTDTRNGGADVGRIIDVVAVDPRDNVLAA